MKLDLLQLSTRQLLDLHHATASALERGAGRGSRQTKRGDKVGEQLLFSLPESALVVDPLSSRK